MDAATAASALMHACRYLVKWVGYELDLGDPREPRRRPGHWERHANLKGCRALLEWTEQLATGELAYLAARPREKRAAAFCLPTCMHVSLVARCC